MARSRSTTRPLPPADPIYGSRLVTRLVNRIMERGKKQTAQGVVYKAFEIIKSKGLEEIKTLETAVTNVGPKMEVKARRVGGASYQVPTEVRGDRRVSLALRWITGYARTRSNKEYKTYAEKLAAELMDAANNTGESIKKRDTVLRNAEANRAFAHFKW